MWARQVRVCIYWYAERATSAHSTSCQFVQFMNVQISDFNIIMPCHGRVWAKCAPLKCTIDERTDIVMSDWNRSIVHNYWRKFPFIIIASTYSIDKVYVHVLNSLWPLINFVAFYGLIIRLKRIVQMATAAIASAPSALIKSQQTLHAIVQSLLQDANTSNGQQ